MATIKALTRDETQVLVDFLKGPEAKPMDILFELLLVAGLRTHELVQIEMRDFNLDTGELVLRFAAKGSDNATFDLNIGGLADRLRAAYSNRDCLLFEQDKLIYLFTVNKPSPESAKRWLRFRWDDLRTKLFGPTFRLGLHSLRHTFGVQVQQLTKSAEDMQPIMRHKDLNSTLHYWRHPTREEFRTTQIEAGARLYDKTYQKD